MYGSLSVAAQVCAILLFGGFVFLRLLKPVHARWVKTRLLPIVVGLFLIGMILPSKWLMYLLIVAVIPVMARRRADSGPVYIMTMLSLPPMTTEIGVGGIYLLGLDKWFMGSLGVLVTALIRKGDGKAASGYFDLPILIFLVLGDLVALRGANPTTALRIQVDYLVSFAIPYFVISRSLRSPEDVARMLLAISFSGFIMSPIALYEARRTFLVYDALSQRLGIISSFSSYTHQRGGVLRAAGPFMEATSFGLFLCTALIATLPLAELFRRKRLWMIALGGLLAGLYATNARASVIVLIIGVFSYDLYRRRYGALLKKTLLLGGLGTIVLAVAQTSERLAERIGLAGNSIDTTDYRKLLIQRGWEEIQKHPWTGITVQQTYAALADLRQGEGIVDFVNAYVFYGMTAGIAGMIAFLLGFLLPAIRSLMTRRQLRSSPLATNLGATLFAICLLTGVSAGTSGFGGRAANIFYLVLAMISALVAARVPRSRPIDDAVPPAMPVSA